MEEKYLLDGLKPHRKTLLSIAIGKNGLIFLLGKMIVLSRTIRNFRFEKDQFQRTFLPSHSSAPKQKQKIFFVSFEMRQVLLSKKIRSKKHITKRPLRQGSFSFVEFWGHRVR